MDYQAVIDKYYPEVGLEGCSAPQPPDLGGLREAHELRRLLIKHSRQVADRALAICKKHPELPVDVQFLEEAAMLHDIGVYQCDAPSIHCHGTEPYIRHGVIGAELLRQEGYERHARVAERHTGTGLTLQQIERQNLPLPHQDYQPQTLEEEMVCYADKFYSKSHPERVRTVLEAAQSLEKFGREGVDKFLMWAKKFE